MRDDLNQRVARARAHLDAGFDASDVERALSGLQQRIVRRRRAQRVGAVASLAALCLGIWLALRTPQAAPLAERERVVRTQDGSLATLLESDTELQVQHDGDTEVDLTLARGAGHFEVSKRPTRRYRVHAGKVEVQVLGTAFDVQRRGERSHVRVTHGAVQVSWPGGQTVLHKGESGWFPRVSQTHADAASKEPAAASEPQAPPAEAASAPAVVQAASDAQEPSAPAQSRRDAERTLARAGKHGEAFRSLDRGTPEAVDDLEGLLLAADAARLSDHPREAALYLERLVKRYPQTAPARLAAFTLAGLQLHELHAPARAARSYARAYELDPHGALAEDALAREAEAWHEAGEARRAASVAERYLQRFPHGVRSAELARYLER